MFNILTKVFLYVESDYVIKNLALRNKNSKILLLFQSDYIKNQKQQYNKFLLEHRLTHRQLYSKIKRIVEKVDIDFKAIHKELNKKLTQKYKNNYTTKTTSTVILNTCGKIELEIRRKYLKEKFNKLKIFKKQ